MFILSDLALSLVVKVHSWYPAYCCSAGDCEKIACTAITKTDTGYWYLGKLAQSVLPSQDQFCHACIPLYGGLRCLFIQLGS